MKSFGLKKFKLHAGVKKCHFGNFSEKPGWPCPVSAALKNPSMDLKNYFCFRKCLKGKLQSALFSRFQSGKKTVWVIRMYFRG